MAALTATVTPIHRIQHERFITEQHGYQLLDLSLSSSGNIAAGGRHDSSRRTFIHLYFGRNSDSRDKLKLFFSKEFEKYSDYQLRRILFIENDLQIVSCIGDKIEIIDTKNESKVIRSCRVNGKITTCVAVREGDIFVGLAGSQTLIVFNNDLKETKKIILEGIQDGDYPWDLQVIKYTVFVCTGKYGKVYTINERGGRVISEFTDSTGKYSRAQSLTVSESLGLVAVVWGRRRIIVYSLNENKSLLVFDDDSNDVERIRISNRDRMMITGNNRTGEIKMYDLDQLFTFEAMKRTLAYTVTPDECEKLMKDFGVSEDELSQVLVGHEESQEEETFKRMECLLAVIEKKGHLHPYSINAFKRAVAAIGDEMHSSNLQGPVEGYILHFKVKYEDLAAEMMTRQNAWEDEKNHLSDALRTAKAKENEYEKTIKDKEGELQKMKNQSEEQEKSLKSQLEKTKQSLESSRVELQQTRTTLTKELTQTQTESAKTADRLTKELAESAKKLEAVQKELSDTKQSLDLSRRESAKQIEILTSKLTQTRTDSARQIEILTGDLERTRTDSAKEMEVVKGKLEEREQSLKLSRTESTKQIDTLELELNQLKQKLNLNMKEKETLCRDLEITKQVLEQTKQDRNDTRTELERCQIELTKESKALKEVLNQTKEAMAALQKQTVEDKPLDNSKETKDEDASQLAAEFGRFTVAVAENLTLDHCLKLARLFNVPASDCDIVRRLSLIESPGMKFLDVLKKRKVINIFDVNNLQKGLAVIHLEAVNHDLVLPYQQSVSDDLYEENKVEEMLTWEDVNTFVKDDSARRQMRDTQTHPEDNTEPDNISQGEIKASQSKTMMEDRSRGPSLKDRHHQFYTECSVGREGGTIQLANISLTIPPDALHEIHVIALTVMNESPFPLDREVDTARMTPLIKLEPLGLIFKKSVQLNIPHSALIPEPENHDVIIYSGQTSKSEGNLFDGIEWAVERSFPRQLQEKSVTIDIQCLSYLSASLETRTMTPPLYIVRAVPFVDGVRSTDDDITLTICFCSDNDAEYNMLLSDYKTKLPLEQYSTLQLHRHSESEEDDAGYLSVTVASVNNTYVPDTEEAVKKFAVSHLCTASRVSHQLRLKKNQSTDRDVVDIKLTFSQAQYEPTEVSLKTRIKDLIISEESEALLTGSLPSGIKEMYKDLVVNISSSLGTKQCRELAAHFQLTSEETEMITSNQDPGGMLMKTLEDRSVIDSQKMILFFEGLKTCHLDEPTGLVSEYISEISRQTQEEQKQEGGENFEETEEGTEAASLSLMKKVQRGTHSSLNDQSVQTTLSSSYVSSDVHVQTLTSEGYTEHEVVEALDISKNRLVMARKVLQFLGEQLDVQPRTDIFLHKEQYIDENGGDIYLPQANVHMVIPTGAITKKSIISLTMMTNEQASVPSRGRTHPLTPVIKCGQEGLTLLKPVTIKIPHCASEIEGISSTDLYLGFSGDGGMGIRWRKRKQHEPAPVLKKDHFEVFLTQFCAVGLNSTVETKKPFSKRLRVLPLIGRVANPSDELIVTLWIYNDDETEHMHLLHREIYVGGKIQLHDFQSLTIKGLGSDKEVHIKSENNRISPNTNIEKLLSSTLWHNTRHSVEFPFQNKEGVNDASFKLRVCRKQLFRIVDELQFDLKVTLDELLQKNQESTTTLLQKQEPQPAMRKPFEELISKLSGQLSMDSCLEIAGIFRLPADFIAKMKESREPGEVLFDELIHEQLITAASVSALDVALSKTGNIHLAEHVKEYRRMNATFPTTIFTLL